MVAVPVSDITSPRFAVPPGTRACWMKNGPLVPEWGMLALPVGKIVVTPWDHVDDRPAGPAIIAAGRDFSPVRLSFSHPDPLPCRFAAVSFRSQRCDHRRGRAIETILARLFWCRFTRDGNYHSGGRFERVLEPEFDEHEILRLLSSREPRRNDSIST